jgi:two-component system nitrate/nitrite response regulator NarL
MQTIAIVLRSPLLRTCINRLLSNAGYSVIGEASEFSDEVSPLVAGVDALIIDAAFWGMGEVQQRVQQTVPDRIVVLGDIDDLRRLTLDQIMAADGILSFDATAEGVIQSLRLVEGGERVIPRELLRSLMASTAPAGPPSGERQAGYQALSERESQMIRYLSRGSCNKVIARQLGITEATVKVHLKNVYRKLRVANRTQAALWGQSNLAA